MTWSLHYHDDGRRLIWLEEGMPGERGKARAIAADRDGVHPRLDARDHRERTCLHSAAACRASTDERGLCPDDIAALVSAATAVPYIRRGEVEWIGLAPVAATAA